MKIVKPIKYGICTALVIGVAASHSSFAALKVIDGGPFQTNNWGLWIDPGKLTVVPLQKVICTIHSDDGPKQITNGAYQFELNPKSDSLICTAMPLPVLPDEPSNVPEGKGQ
jgi:hypothetical protein